MSEDPRERTLAYLAAAEKSIKQAETVKDPDALRIVDHARRYLSDSRYFLETGKPTTALASVAYAEGLLDSLSIIGMLDMKMRND